MPDTFAREWTWRTPLVTQTYPAGWTGTLPEDRCAAAAAAGALETPEPETVDGDEGIAAPRAPRRTLKAKI